MKRKISVVMPVFNGRTTLRDSLSALVKQEEAECGVDYEVIVIDDGSVDGSAELVRNEFPMVRLIEHEKNKGRIEARYTGVQAANYDVILLIDVRVIASSNLISTFWAIGCPLPCMAGDLGDADKTDPLSRVFYCIRSAYYKDKSTKEKQARLTITKENFLRAPKGTTAIFLLKEHYLGSMPAQRGKFVNDDTKLFANLIEKTPLYRDKRLKVIYLQRLELREEIPHLYERGVRFADYYIKSGGPYRWYAVTSVLVMAVIMLMIALMPIGASVVLLCIFTFCCIVLARATKDFFYLLLLLPLLVAVFASGAVVGMTKRT